MEVTAEERAGDELTADGLAAEVRGEAALLAAVLPGQLWGQRDANWNVTALVDGSGAVVERYAYDPFRARGVYGSGYTVRTGGSAYGMAVGFQGLRQDG